MNNAARFGKNKKHRPEQDITGQDRGPALKPPKFDYFAPATIAEAVEILAEHGSDARPLAGGQSLVPALNFRLARPEVLVDLNRIPELSYIEASNGHVAVGAMTRQRMIENSTEIAGHAPLVSAATRHIGHLPTRSRGTIGGSLSNADPAAEYPAVALALDAIMVIRGKDGERRVEANDFFQGLLTTAVEPGEILAAVEFSKAPPGTGCSFQEISRRHGDFALAGVGAQITVSQGKVTEARFAACGVAPGPVRLSAAEEIILAEGATDKSIAAASDAAMSAVDPSSDVHGSADYRRRLAGAMAARAIADAAQRAMEAAA